MDEIGSPTEESASAEGTRRRFTANLQYGGQYRGRMEEAERLQQCDFCNWAKQLDDITDTRLLVRTPNWFARRRDWPYKGKNGALARQSVMIMPIRHVVSEEELTPQDAVERQALIHIVARVLGMKGFCEFARYGDPDRSGATYLHFHIHLVEPGDHPNPDPEKDGKSDPIAFWVG